MRPSHMTLRATQSATSTAGTAAAAAARLARMARLAMLAGFLGGALALGGCQAAGDSGLVWSDNFDDSTDDVRFKEDEFPKLADAPSERPSAPSMDQIDDLADGLAADRQNAQHSANSLNQY